MVKRLTTQELGNLIITGQEETKQSFQALQDTLNSGFAMLANALGGNAKPQIDNSVVTTHRVISEQKTPQTTRVLPARKKITPDSSIAWYEKKFKTQVIAQFVVKTVSNAGKITERSCVKLANGMELALVKNSYYIPLRKLTLAK